MTVQVHVHVIGFDCVRFQAESETDFESDLASRLRNRKRRLQLESTRREKERTTSVGSEVKVGEITESEIEVIPCSQDEADSHEKTSSQNSDSRVTSRSRLRRSRRLQGAASTSTPINSQTPRKKSR